MSEPKNLKDLRVKMLKGKVSMSDFKVSLCNGMESTLSGCSFIIDADTAMMSKYVGEYDLSQLICDLPLETLAKYKVDTTRAPAPGPVKRKK